MTPFVSYFLFYFLSHIKIESTQIVINNPYKTIMQQQQLVKRIYYNLKIDITKVPQLVIEMDAFDTWVKATTIIPPIIYDLNSIINRDVIKIKKCLNAIGMYQYQIIIENNEISDETRNLIIGAFKVPEEITSSPKPIAVIPTPEIKNNKQDTLSPLTQTPVFTLSVHAKQIIKHIETYGKNPDFANPTNKTSCINYIRNILSVKASDGTAETIYEQLHHYFSSRK